MPGLLAAIALACLTAPAASANIGGLFPTDEDGGTAIEVIRSDQNLFVYALSDVQGGDVCIKPASLENPGDGTLKCVNPAWGTSNRIIGIGSSWTLIEAPYLKAGEWKLLADGGSDESVDVFSNEFTVMPCEPGACDPRLALATAQRYKGAAAEMAASMKGMSATVKYLTEIAPLEPTQHVALIVDAETSPLYLRVLADKVARKLGFVTRLPSGPHGMALAIAQQVSADALEMYLDIYNDPPEDYATVAQPEFDLPALSTGDADIDGLMLDIAQLVGYGAAGLNAYERYQQAVIEDSDVGVHRQAAAMGRFDGQFAAEMWSSAAGLDAWAAKLEADPDYGGATVQQEQIDNLRPILERVRTSGLDADERQQLEDLGFDDAQIAKVTGELSVDDLDDIEVGVPIQDLVRSVADDLREHAPAFDAMAREAEAVAQSTDSPPTASFDATPDSGAPPLEVAFTDTSEHPDDEPLVITWDFGDGSAPETGPAVSHTFDEGTFEVTETISDGVSTSTATRTIVAHTPNQPPTADIARSPAEGDAPLLVDFDASGSSDPDGSIMAYEWDFGDGTVELGPIVSHTYDEPGDYTATLTITDDRGATATATADIEVRVPPENQPPVAEIARTPADGDAPLAVNFDGTASRDPDGDIVTFEWAFGDGTSELGASISHTYADPGDYTATLTVTDDRGATATATATIVARDASQNYPPVATADTLVTRQGTARSVNVLANDTDPDGDTLQVIDTTPPAHGTVTCEPGGDCSYAPDTGFSGSDAFTYVVEDAAGVTATGNVAVTVNAGNEDPIADAGPDLDIAEESGAYFDASNSKDADGTIATYEWDFGDGSEPETTTVPQVVHAYGRPGTFTARLLVTDDGGAGAEDTVLVNVANVAPSVSLGALPRAPVGITRPYDAVVSTGSTEPTTLTVDFGDGSATVSKDVLGYGTHAFEHAYATAGAHTLTYTVTDSVGETATATGTVTVADATADAGPDRTVDEGASVQLEGASTPPDEHTTVTWNFGDGSSPGDGVQPEHVYRDEGEYTATVTVTDDAGTTSDAARISVVNVAPTARISASHGIAPGEPVSFRGVVRDPGTDDVLSRHWSFGDGTTGSGRTVEHRYDTAGTYSVELRVEDGDGGTAVTTASVVVGAAPGRRDSAGRDFWFAFPTNYTPNEPALTLFIAGEEATSGRVEIAGVDFAVAYTVTPGQVTAVTLPPEAQLAGSGAQDRGIHVTAGEDVSVYGLNRIKYTTDAFLGLPTDALGTTYRVVSYSGGGTEAAVVATANDTTVTITPSTALSDGKPAGEPFEIELDLGEAYQLLGDQDLTGTLIAASKPVAAFGGHNCANVPSGVSYCDHLVEQLTPVDSWGRQFVTMPLATRSKGDTFRVLAAEDDTTVSIDGERVATLAAGGFHEQLVEGPATIDADKPILVVQYSNGSSFDATASDPFMVILAPYEQFQSGYTVATPAEGFAQNFLNLVVPSAGAAGVRVDGELVPEGSFEPIGDSGFVGAQIPIALGDHRIASSVPLGVTVYGFDTDDSYGYGGGLAVGEVATVHELRLSPGSEDLATGSSGCVDATALTDGGDAVEDVRIDFSVSGANATSGFATTGADGVARFCYPGASVGDDVITASLGVVSRTATKHWRAPNRAPVAVDDDTETLAGDPLEIPAATLLANDSDPDGDAIAVTTVAATSASHGTVRLAGGTVTYTPEDGYSGDASFRYTVSDGQGASAEGVVSVRVVPKPGISIDDVTVDETDGPGGTARFSLSLTGASPNSVSVHYETEDGTAGSPGDFTARSGTVTFAPGQLTSALAVDVTGDAVHEGDEAFEVHLASPVNATLARSLGTARIRDDDPLPQRAPVAVDDTASTQEDESVTIAPAALLANDTDPDGDVLSIADVTPNGATHGTAKVVGGSVVYVPAPDFNGPAELAYRVADGHGNSATAKVRVTVAPVQDAPVARADAAATDQDTPLGIPVGELLANDADADGDSLSVTAVAATSATHGNVELAGGTVRFAPNAGHTGVSSFAYTLSDGHGNTGTGRVDVTVRPSQGAGAVLGEATTAADLLLGCTERLVVLEDVVPAGRRVRLVGVADRRFVGQTVSIAFAPTAKVVARPKVGADGSFSATAPLPPARLRNTNAARYEARIGRHRSLKLKLARRMRITKMTASGGRVTIAGRVIGPLAARRADRTIELQRRVSCTRNVRAARTLPRANGTFRLSVKAPPGKTAAVYRLRTKVRSSPKSSRPVNTFTLPRGIDF